MIVLKNIGNIIFRIGNAQAITTHLIGKKLQEREKEKWLTCIHWETTSQVEKKIIYKL